MEKLIGLIENYVEVDEIKAGDAFKADLGMSSFDTVCLISDIKTEFGIELKPSDFVKNKTVGELAEYISAI